MTATEQLYERMYFIRRFEADYTNSAGGTAGGPPTVHVSLSCVLGRRSDRELITSFESS